MTSEYVDTVSRGFDLDLDWTCTVCWFPALQAGFNEHIYLEVEGDDNIQDLVQTCKLLSTVSSPNLFPVSKILLKTENNIPSHSQ